MNELNFEANFFFFKVSPPKELPSFPFPAMTADTRPPQPPRPQRDTQLFGMDGGAPTSPRTPFVGSAVTAKRISTERLKLPASLRVPMSDPFRPDSMNSAATTAPMTPEISLALSPPPNAAAPGDFQHGRRRSSARSWASHGPPGEGGGNASPSSSVRGVLVTPQPAVRMLPQQQQQRPTLAPIRTGHQQQQQDFWPLPPTPDSPVGGHMDSPTVLGARDLEGIVTFAHPLSSTATSAAYTISFPLLTDMPMAVPPALQAALPPLAYASILREFNTLYLRYRWHMRVHTFFLIFSTLNTVIAAALLVFAPDLRAAALPLMLMYLLFTLLFNVVSAINLAASRRARVDKMTDYAAYLTRTSAHVKNTARDGVADQYAGLLQANKILSADASAAELGEMVVPDDDSVVDLPEAKSTVPKIVCLWSVLSDSSGIAVVRVEVQGPANMLVPFSPTRETSPVELYPGTGIVGTTRADDLHVVARAAPVSAAAPWDAQRPVTPLTPPRSASIPSDPFSPVGRMSGTWPRTTDGNAFPPIPMVPMSASADRPAARWPAAAAAAANISSLSPPPRRGLSSLERYIANAVAMSASTPPDDWSAMTPPQLPQQPPRRDSYMTSSLDREHSGMQTQNDTTGIPLRLHPLVASLDRQLYMRPPALGDLDLGPSRLISGDLLRAQRDFTQNDEDELNDGDDRPLSVVSAPGSDGPTMSAIIANLVSR
ncbi:hypothetical protein BC828DRAFT_399276 [Blastocladiella britannica]|nr:hypothetical protein BC828DRAFT_399276 [Blastocladiella britannica]